MNRKRANVVRYFEKGCFLAGRSQPDLNMRIFTGIFCNCFRQTYFCFASVLLLIILLLHPALGHATEPKMGAITGIIKIPESEPLPPWDFEVMVTLVVKMTGEEQEQIIDMLKFPLGESRNIPYRLTYQISDQYDHVEIRAVIVDRESVEYATYVDIPSEWLKKDLVSQDLVMYEMQNATFFGIEPEKLLKIGPVTITSIYEAPFRSAWMPIWTVIKVDMPGNEKKSETIYEISMGRYRPIIGEEYYIYCSIRNLSEWPVMDEFGGFYQRVRKKPEWWPWVMCRSTKHPHLRKGVGAYTTLQSCKSVR